MDKQRVAVIGPGSWGTALSQVLNDNGHEVRIWGNIAEQINEFNDEPINAISKILYWTKRSRLIMT